MKNLHLALVSAAAICSTGAFAADLGTINLSTGSAFFGNTPQVGTFVDTLNFSLTSMSTLNASITSVVNVLQNVNFSSISLSGPSGTFSLSQLSPDPIELWATGASGLVLSPGNYTMTLAGTNSLGAGSYAGNIGVSVVPEPETLALMLAGLVAVGFIALRRLPRRT